MIVYNAASLCVLLYKQFKSCKQFAIFRRYHATLCGSLDQQLYRSHASNLLSTEDSTWRFSMDQNIYRSPASSLLSTEDSTWYSVVLYGPESIQTSRMSLLSTDDIMWHSVVLWTRIHTEVTQAVCYLQKIARDSLWFSMDQTLYRSHACVCYLQTIARDTLWFLWTRVTRAVC